jgi:hypothetical protein
MFLADRLTLDAPRRTSDGYMAVRAKAARTGVYQYGGSEVDPDNKHGLRDQQSVNVLRDADQVFAADSVRSFLMKPITNDHPKEAVTAANWRDHARGVAAGAMRDGDHLAFDLVLMDSDAIAAVDAGKVELSNGYSADLEFGDFTAPDGTKCAARQTNIRGNHIALVDAGRAGPSCRIGDAAPCASATQSFLDSLHTQEKPVKTMLIDGLTVDISNADTAMATITTILAARDAATGKIAGLETQVATLTTDKATLEAQVATLDQAVKDAAPTPQQLRDAARTLGIAIGKAKALGVTVTDAMDEPAIMKAVVSAKMGDAAKDWNDAQIAASFAVLAKDAKVVTTDGLADALVSNVTNIGDAATDRQKALDARRNHNATAFRAAAEA